MATLGQLVGIQNDHEFQGRVAGALGVAAAAVYSETNIVATIASTAVGSKVLSFASVPSWIIPGSTASVVDITTSGAIPSSAVVATANFTASTVTLSIPVTGTSVLSGDIISFTQHAQRAAFARNVVNGNYNLPAACFAVLGNSTIASEANPTTMPDFAIADADIQFAVNSLWNVLAGA